MGTNTSSLAQIISIIAFVAAVFGLYRLLVDTKDATIVNLREKIALLEKQLEMTKASAPDVLVDVLKKRVDISNSEMVRLKEDVEKLSAEVDKMREEEKQAQTAVDKIAADLKDLGASLRNARKASLVKLQEGQKEEEPKE